ncbi:MAG: hemolysin family protein [Woeseiaceae bacterium]
MVVFVSAVAVVLVVSFLCSIFESVLLSVSRPQVETMVQQGKRSGKLMLGFKQNFDVPIAAILILNTAAHTVGASVAGASFTSVFDAESLWIFSVLFTLAVLLFTEIIPKTLGVTHALKLATPVAYGIHWLVRILWPIVAVSERLSRLLRPEEKQPVTSPEELRLLASLGRNEGVVSSGTAGIIVGATQLREMRALDVMLPRQSVVYLHAMMTRADVEQTIRRSAHSRFPFSTTESIDDVASIILVKELLYWLHDHPGAEIDWSELQREVLIVPENTPVPRLLKTFQQAHRHLAMVVDEYGGVEGIVTMEDVLEEIVGEINDESDRPATDFKERYDGALVVRGSVDMRRLSQHLDRHWDASSDATTIGGQIVEELERIPKIGESIEWHGYEVEVINADERRIKTVVLRRLDNEDTTEG